MRNRSKAALMNFHVTTHEADKKKKAASSYRGPIVNENPKQNIAVEGVYK